MKQLYILSLTALILISCTKNNDNILNTATKPAMPANKLPSIACPEIWCIDIKGDGNVLILSGTINGIIDFSNKPTWPFGRPKTQLWRQVSVVKINDDKFKYVAKFEMKNNDIYYGYKALTKRSAWEGAIRFYLFILENAYLSSGGVKIKDSNNILNNWSKNKLNELSNIFHLNPKKPTFEDKYGYRKGRLQEENR